MLLESADLRTWKPTVVLNTRHDDRDLVSYYDGELYEPGVPKRSDIKLATIQLR